VLPVTARGELRYVAKRLQGFDGVAIVSPLANQDQALSTQSFRPFVVLLGQGDNPEAVERVGDTVTVSQLSKQGQALVKQRISSLVVSLTAGDQCRAR
jgi:hypothetical protein